MKRKLTYKISGVDIEKGEAFSRWIREKVSPVGGFGGIFPLQGYKNPILVGTCDGVGTKVKIAQSLRKHSTIGIDLVAMNVNDLLPQGAKPLFFLDYLAMGKLSLSVAKSILSGVIEGCRKAGCILLGGETAEMPGVYKEGEYELAGFAVGVVERENLIDGSRISPGDLLVGIPSSGLHSNGFSLVRKIFPPQEFESYREEFGSTLGEELLKPTRIYTFLLPSLFSFRVKGVVHITGGGMVKNIPRILPPGLKALIRKGSWEIPPIFSLLKERGEVEDEEMFRVFNMGIGMILILSPEDVSPLRDALSQRGEKTFLIGEIIPGERGVEIK